MQVTVLSATSGNNLKIATLIEKEFLASGIECSLINLETLDLPLYMPSKEGEVPSGAIELKDALCKSQAYVVCGPEYNGSIPPVISNAIAWVSRSGAEDWRSAFNEKIAIVATHSGGPGTKYLESMRIQLSHLGSVVFGRTLAANYQKELNMDSVKAIVSNVQKLIG